MAISFNRDAQESTLNPLQISRIKLYNENIFLLIMKRAEAMSRTHRELAVGSHLISEKGEGREKETKAEKEKEKRQTRELQMNARARHTVRLSKL